LQLKEHIGSEQEFFFCQDGLAIVEESVIKNKDIAGFKCNFCEDCIRERAEPLITQVPLRDRLVPLGIDEESRGARAETRYHAHERAPVCVVRCDIGAIPVRDQAATSRIPDHPE